MRFLEERYCYVVDGCALMTGGREGGRDREEIVGGTVSMDGAFLSRVNQYPSW